MNDRAADVRAVLDDIVKYCRGECVVPCNTSDRWQRGHNAAALLIADYCERVIKQDLARLRQELENAIDWRADVTVALQREGGAFYADVPGHIKDLVQENATLRQRVGEREETHERWAKMWNLPLMQVHRQLKDLTEALDRLPKVEGGREIRVIESPSITPQNTEYYYCVEADLDEGQTWDLGTFDTYEEAEAYAALLQARKELGG